MILQKTRIFNLWFFRKSQTNKDYPCFYVDNINVYGYFKGASQYKGLNTKDKNEFGSANFAVGCNL